MLRRVPAVRGRVPAVSIEKSVTPNVLVCLDTGVRRAALRRHLGQSLGLSPAEYRRRWGLPDDYPMVSQSYISARNATLFGAQPKVGHETE